MRQPVLRWRRRAHAMATLSGPPLRAVVFDIDGTLYPIRQIVRRSWPLVCRHARLFAAFGRARRGLRGERPGNGLRQRQAELVAGYLGIDTATAAEAVERVVYRQWPRTFRRLQPYPEVAATLARLRAGGLRLGVVSDSPFTHEKLAALGLGAGWGGVVSADQAGALKPNPEPFLLILRLLQVRPEEVLFVGNSYAHDMIGAHRVGMRAAHLTRHPVTSGVAAVSFPNYRSFPEIPQAVRPVHPARSQ